MPSRPDDPYHRLDYRRVIAWPARIQREAPFLARHLPPPPGPILDLGCGTGEHARFLHGEGYRVVGVDRSDAQIEAARDYATDGLDFLAGDLTDPRLDPGRDFAGALCLGNALPSFEDRDLEALLANLRRWLAPGAPLLLQILNYAGLRARAARHLPVNVRDDEESGGEIVFLRLLQWTDPHHVRFLPSTLRIPPGEEPVELKAARHVVMRTWERGDLQARFTAGGFGSTEWFGSVTGDPFDAATSPDLVGVLRRD